MSKKEKQTQRCYYDACTLDGSKQTFREILNKDDANNCIISHLALGEAYGNSVQKGDRIADEFLKLVRQLKPYIKIVNHDGIETILGELLQQTDMRVEAADAMHIATAIKYNCEVLRTLDYGMYNMSSSKINAFAGRHGLSIFSISEKGL